LNLSFTMKIIVASYPKTGTKSIAYALKYLGYNVYDYLEHFWYHEKEWKEICIHGSSVDTFKKMYSDVDAVVDLPAFYFWEEIHEAFPDAKVRTQGMKGFRHFQQFTYTLINENCENVFV